MTISDESALLAAATLSNHLHLGSSKTKAITTIDAPQMRMECQAPSVEIDELRRSVDRLRMEESPCRVTVPTGRDEATAGTADEAARTWPTARNLHAARRTRGRAAASATCASSGSLRSRSWRCAGARRKAAVSRTARSQIAQEEAREPAAQESVGEAEP